MKTLGLKYFYLTTAFVFAILTSAFSQIPDFSKVPILHDGDSANILYLITNGVKIANGKTVCWFPKDSLSNKQMNEIVHVANIGIKRAEKFINAPLPWQSHGQTEPYTFYFRFDRFVSHASGAGFVSVPFWRIKEGKAPWLHEVIHEMLYTKTGSWHSDTITDKAYAEKRPLWLSEGLPEYIAVKVSLLENLPRFDVFSNSQQTNIDSLFVTEMNADKGSYILSFIGREGVMPELFSDERIRYAPAFYHGSSSFVKYLADSYGVKILLAGISSFQQEHEVIEKLTGKKLDLLKKEWLAKLKQKE